MNLSLYLVTNQDILKQKSILKAIKQAIKGGVSVVQLREKELDYKDFLRLAKKVKKLTDKHRIPLIINDNIKIAKKINASGVHIGQNDEGIKKARKILKNNIIGVSVQNKKRAKKAQKLGADYLGIGTIFATSTKKDTKKPIGLKKLKKIASSVTIPKVAIGGINLKNTKSVMKCGVDGVAVVSAILASKNIKKTSKRFRKLIDSN